MKPTGYIAGIVIFVTDAADHARRRTADLARWSRPGAGQGFFGQREPDVAYDRRIVW